MEVPSGRKRQILGFAVWRGRMLMVSLSLTDEWLLRWSYVSHMEGRFMRIVLGSSRLTWLRGGLPLTGWAHLRLLELWLTGTLGNLCLSRACLPHESFDQVVLGIKTQKAAWVLADCRGFGGVWVFTCLGMLRYSWWMSWVLSVKIRRRGFSRRCWSSAVSLYDLILVVSISSICK